MSLLLALPQEPLKTSWPAFQYLFGHNGTRIKWGLEQANWCICHLQTNSYFRFFQETALRSSSSYRRNVTRCLFSIMRLPRLLGDLSVIKYRATLQAQTVTDRTRMCLPKPQSGTQWSDQQAKSFEGHGQTTLTTLSQEQQGNILQSQKESASD